MFEIFLAGEKLVLLAEKAVIWPRHKTLFISDLHLGKVMHFRKAGIAVPQGAALHNYDRLADLFQIYRPERVIFLGDLFHSEKNSEWELFSDLVKNHLLIDFDLISGNHDILNRESYQKINITIHEEGLVFAPFFLSHYPHEKKDLFNLCGHLHPGVRIKGKARQSLRLSCYWVKQSQMVLPAFGIFTGMHVISPKKEEILYAIANRQILKIEQ